MVGRGSLRGKAAAVLCALALLWPGLAQALSPSRSVSDFAGERLRFSIAWSGIPAGTAILEVVGVSPDRLEYRLSAKTLPWIDVIYPVRTEIEATVELPSGRPLRYVKRSKEGGKERDEELVFDYAAGTVTTIRHGRVKRTRAIPPEICDPLSVFYTYRAIPPSEAPVHLEITDGKRVITGEASVLKRERISTPAGTFPCVLVEPRMEGLGGVFRKSPGARLLVWLTDDAWRRPVRLWSKVIVGAFTANLEEVLAAPSS